MSALYVYEYPPVLLVVIKSPVDTSISAPSIGIPSSSVRVPLIVTLSVTTTSIGPSSTDIIVFIFDVTFIVTVILSPLYVSLPAYSTDSSYNLGYFGV